MAKMTILGLKESTEFTAYVYGACLLVGHGRLPTPLSYTVTAAYGLWHAVKCWAFAAKRQRLLSGGNRGRDSYGDYRALMTLVYDRMAIVARN